MPPDRRPQRLGLGILLLAYKLNEFGLKFIPPVTLIFVAVQTLLYVGIIRPPWNYYDVCISGHAILFYGDYKRLFLSALEHADDFHLYHNMISFLLKGKSLEERYGSQKFLILLIVFVLSTGMTYVGLAFVAARLLEDPSMMHSCAVGFSGVIFALKVLTTYHRHERSDNIFGFYVPSKYAVWAELITIHILAPNSSFMGHLAGIIVGLLYIKGPLQFVVDSLNYIVNKVTRYDSYDEPNDYYNRPSFVGRGNTFQQRSNSNYHQNYDTFDEDEIRRPRMHRFT